MQIAKYNLIFMQILPFSDQVHDDDVVDQKTTEGENVDKEEKVDVVELIQKIYVDSKKQEDIFVINLKHLRIFLQSHFCGALIIFYMWMLSLAEHDGLWRGQ